MLNPDGCLWVDRLGVGLADAGESFSPADGERIVRLVARHVCAKVHAGSPRVSAEPPETGERFEGLLPLVVAAPLLAEFARLHRTVLKLVRVDDVCRDVCRRLMTTPGVGAITAVTFESCTELARLARRRDVC